ncbi:MAG: OmpA family protein, partial [Desulfovibrionales bacterium]|nr:OmpA family protein [Desulfovibrionales bacterium]
MDHLSHSPSILTKEDQSSWLVTYADMMTLLLVFFVLLYSLAGSQLKETKAQVEKMEGNLESPPPVARKISLEEVTGLSSRRDGMVRKLGRFTRPLGEDAQVLSGPGGKIIILVSGQALFQSGRAELNDHARSIFDDLIALLDAYPEYGINIKGHTDDIPIATQQFPSNWELSAIRATTVLKYFIRQGIAPQRL